MGLRISTTLPTTNQDTGLGNNATDITLALSAANHYGPLSFFADLGVGILSAPIEPNEQNDVLVYGFGFIWRLSNRLQLAGEANGIYSTRKGIPVGTEDRGRVQLGLAWRLSNVAVEFFPSYGLMKREGTFGVVAGLSWQFNLSFH